ncbi:MAG: hypothetical protein WD042_06975 [Phycisphaeraceae bacterium]
MSHSNASALKVRAPKRRSKPLATAEELARLSNEAVRRAIARHHAEGRSVPIMRDAKIVWLQPNGTITSDDEQAAKHEG